MINIKENSLKMLYCIHFRLVNHNLLVEKLILSDISFKNYFFFSLEFLKISLKSLQVKFSKYMTF